MFNNRQFLVIIVVLLLDVATLAPLSAYGDISVTGNVTATAAANSLASAALDEEGAKPRRKGNGFVRAITAPFRALGRLFGGGKNKSREAARAQAAEASKAVAVRASEEPKRKEPQRESSAREAAATTSTIAATPEAALVSPAVPATDQPGVRIIRPAEGGDAARALAQPRKWIPVIEGLPKDHLSQGRALLQHGYVNEAIAELSVAATVGPDLAEANNLLGMAFDRVGQHQQAVEAYERALSVASDNAQVLNNLGYSLYLADKHDAALKRLKQAAKLAPGAPDVLSNMGLVQARRGKYGDAFKSLTRAYGEYQARIKVGELLEKSGRTGDAIKHYEAALRIEPTSAALLQRLADLYDRTGRANDAEAARRRAGEQPNKQKTATGGGGG